MAKISGIRRQLIMAGSGIGGGIGAKHGQASAAGLRRIKSETARKTSAAAWHQAQLGGQRLASLGLSGGNAALGGRKIIIGLHQQSAHIIWRSVGEIK